MKHITLDDLFTSIATAVNEAQSTLNREYLNHLISHFDAAEEGHLLPKTIPIVLPRQHVEEGQKPEAVHNIPQAALAHGRPLTLGHVKMELDCLVEGMEEGSSELTLLLDPPVGDTRSSGRLTLDFSCGETPEGVARLHDRLLMNF